MLELVCLNCLKIAVKGRDKSNLIKQIKEIKSQHTKKAREKMAKKDGEQKDKSLKCPHCNAILERFKIEYLSKGKTESKIPVFVKCTKFQAYKIKHKLTGYAI